MGLFLSDLTHIKTDQEKRKRNNDLFVSSYDSSKYSGMFVTADIVILTLNAECNLCILLIQRQAKNNYEAGLWAIPGGFVKMDESSQEAAIRELQEETGIKNVHIEQFGTFDDPKRDGRARIISVAYMAFVPMARLDEIKGSDDAQDAKLFEIKRNENQQLILVNEKYHFYITGSDLGFDHEKIINTAINRLDRRFAYTEDIFEFIKNKNAFTASELRKVWESMTGEKQDIANFRRDIIQKYLDNGTIEDTGKRTTEFSKRPAAIYKKK